jgi:hypothetical protein
MVLGTSAKRRPGGKPSVALGRLAGLPHETTSVVSRNSQSRIPSVAVKVAFSRPSSLVLPRSLVFKPLPPPARRITSVRGFELR